MLTVQVRGRHALQVHETTELFREQVLTTKVSSLQKGETDIYHFIKPVLPNKLCPCNDNRAVLQAEHTSCCIPNEVLVCKQLEAWSMYCIIRMHDATTCLSQNKCD